MSDLFSDHGIEIKLSKKEDFLKVKETLTRIGVASSGNQTLNQSCHILHKRGRYAILHFKELFLLDGKDEITDIESEDYARRNAIVKLLSDWGLIQVIESEKMVDPTPSMSQVKVIKHEDKENWQLISKYTIGKAKKKPQI